MVKKIQPTAIVVCGKDKKPKFDIDYHMKDGEIVLTQTRLHKRSSLERTYSFDDRRIRSVLKISEQVIT